MKVIHNPGYRSACHKEHYHKWIHNLGYHPTCSGRKTSIFVIRVWTTFLRDRKDNVLRKNSIKNTRINEEVKRELSRLILSELKDPRISPFTSVTSVEVAPDLKQAKVYISVLGDAQAQENTKEGLLSAAPFLRTALAHTINLRNTPQLLFIMDQSIAYGVSMSHLIDQVTEQDARAAAGEKREE